MHTWDKNGFPMQRKLGLYKRPEKIIDSWAYCAYYSTWSIKNFCFEVTSHLGQTQEKLTKQGICVIQYFHKPPMGVWDFMGFGL
jgi:hypothetical protein